MMTDTAKKIKMIELKIKKDKELGYGGIDINIVFKNAEQQKYIRNYFEPKVIKYIDWNTDDLYGKGVGYNINGAYTHNCISIDFLETRF